ncbi:MAG: hypothetical protein IJ630_00505 [Treponema sp.]|nr:hypothetical protein [Treponema sp.]
MTAAELLSKLKNNSVKLRKRQPESGEGGVVAQCESLSEPSHRKAFFEK